MKKYRQLARRIFQIAKKHNVSEHGEGWPIHGAEANVRKALGIADGAEL